MRTFLQTWWGRFATFLLVGLAVYGYSIVTNEWVNWDDLMLIADNPLLATLNWQTLQGMFTTYDPNLYVPLTYVSWHIDRILAGGTLTPQVTHFMNLVYHALSATTLSYIATRLLGSKRIGIIAALIFLVHPLHTEAVAWASARKDVLSTALLLISVLYYLRFKEGSRRSYSYSVGFFAFALLSKVTVMTMPFILIIIDLWQRRLTWRDKWAYFGLSLVFGIISLDGKADTGSFLLEKILIGARALWWYLEKFIVPVKLAVFYPFTDSISLTNPELTVSLLAAMTLTVVCVGLYMKRYRALPLAWAFYVITVAPTFANFTKGDHRQMDVYIGSDRYAYIPTIVCVLFVAYALHYLWQRKASVGALATTILLSVYAVLTFQQTKVWQQTAYLFLNVITHYDNAQLAYNNLGVDMMVRGLPERGLALLNKSLEIRPNEKAYYHIGQHFADQNNFSEAKKYYRLSLEQNPHYVPANAQLGAVYLVEGQPQQAIAYLEVAATDDPTHVTATYNTALAYEQVGQMNTAAKWYEKVLALDPSDTTAQQKVNQLRR